MGEKRIFAKYYLRLMWEGIIKGFICALITGFAASIIPAYLAFSTNNFNSQGATGFWIALVVGIVLVIITTPLYYLAFFRPDTKKMILRIDRLGMDERLVTMLELEKDSSFMAMLQREDAKAKLKLVKARQLKLKVFILPIVLLTLITFCSLTMVAVTVTEFEENMPWVSAGEREEDEKLDNIETIDPDPQDQPSGEKTHYKILFTIYGNGAGYFEGDVFQVVPAGENTTLVVAVPEPGWIFKEWWMESLPEDELKNPQRIIYNVDQDRILWAEFIKPGDGEGEGEQENPEPDKMPEPNPDDSQEGEFNPNVIIDGKETYELAEYWEYYMELYKQATGNADMPADLKKLLEEFYGRL